jgi:LacI family transcriptional regulator
VAVLVDTSTDWSRRVVAGIMRYVRTHDFWHLFVEPRGAEEPLELPRGWQGDGIIARIGSLRMARSLAARRIPVVNVSAIHIPDAPDFPRVNADVADTAKVAADYFRERGFRNFGYLSLQGLEYAARQQTAFVQAVNNAGCECAVFGVKTHAGAQSPDWNLRIEKLAGWLLSLPKPVAILTWSGGREVIHACDAAGLRVPEEVALLSGSDDFLCEAARVPISGVQAACERIGSEAAALLHRLMRGGRPPRHPLLIPPVRIVTRQSTDTLAISDPAMVKALTFIRENASRNIRVKQVASHAGISRRLLEQRFMAILSRTPAEHIRRARLDRARTLLAETDLPIDQVAEAAGFGSPEYMTCFFRQATKLTPLKFRRQSQRSTPVVPADAPGMNR